MRFNTIARSLVAGAAVLGLAALAAPKANADVTLTLVGGPVAVAGGFQFTYNVNLLSGTEISQGSVPTPGGGLSLAQGTTMFDFFGLVGTPTFTASASGASFIISTPQFGTQTPAFGETAALNIDAVYNGSFIAAPAGDPILLGQIFAVSTSGNVVIGANPFSSTSETTATQQAATNQGSASGPGTTLVPEANAGLLAGLALPLLGGVAILRRKKN